MLALILEVEFLNKLYLNQIAKGSFMEVIKKSLDSVDELMTLLQIQISNRVNHIRLTSEDKRVRNLRTIKGNEEFRTLLKDPEVLDTLIRLSDK